MTPAGASAIGHGAYRDFQGRIDQAFRKGDPDFSIPWTGAAPPAWALRFRPRSIMDIGCATAQFTSAVIEELGRWGCLQEIESVVLVEEEAGFDEALFPRALNEARARCEAVLARYGRANARVTLINEAVQLSHAGVASDPRVPITLLAGGETLPTVDLIVASHVTYYFPYGGDELVRAIRGHLSSLGLAWVVVRRRACPIYQGRIAALLGGSDSEEHSGYAEDLIAAVRSGALGVNLVDTRDHHLLPSEGRPADCVKLAHLLMWRAPLDDHSPRHQVDAATEVCSSPEPLFSESHLILGPD